MTISSTKIVLSMLVLLGICQTATAEDAVQNFWQDTKITGQIRNYYFTRNYVHAAKLDQFAFSIGGDLHILTGAFWSGFRIGATAYTAQPLGLNSDNPARVDNTLPGDAVNALTEAYLQYARAHFLIRAGNQIINTPWLNAGDSRMIPASYRGIFTTWAPTKNWDFTALRIYQFKSRVANDFSATNIYNPENQGIPIPKLSTKTDDGAQAVGMHYKTENVDGQLWAYQFFDFAKLLYGDVQYTFMPANSVKPFIAAQFLTEGGDGNNILEQVSTGKADALGYGALVGMETPRAKITLAYNHLAPHSHAYNNGDVVSPYTITSDPLYTTSMISGLVDKTAGEAWKITGIFYALDKQLQFLTSYAQYFTQPYLPNTQETDLDITYIFKKSTYKPLRGLSIRNRLGLLTGDPTKGRFYYNRVMLQYSF